MNKLDKKQLSELREQIIQSSYILRNHPPEPEVGKNCKEMNLTRYKSSISLPCDLLDSTGYASRAAFDQLAQQTANSIDLVIKRGNENYPVGPDQSEMNNLLGVKHSIFRDVLEDEVKNNGSLPDCDISFDHQWMTLHPTKISGKYSKVEVHREGLKFYLFLDRDVMGYNIACDCVEYTLWYSLGWTWQDMMCSVNENAKPMKDLDDIVNVQVSDPTSKTDSYMRGMANGLLIAQSVLKDSPCEFIEAPKKKSLVKKIFG